MLLSIDFNNVSKRNQLKIDMARISNENWFWAIKFVFNPLFAILNYLKKIPIFFEANVNEFLDSFQTTWKPKEYLI